MDLAVVDAAERNDEFVAHLSPQSTRLHEAGVMIGMLSPAN
jgi:hypothetical protein